MKKFLGRVFICSVVSLAVAASAHATSVAYISYANEPWGLPGNVNALDDVFGAGNWDREQFATAAGNGVLTPGGYDFIFIDGGDGASVEFEAFVNANRAGLESFVSNGGSLFINAARWDATDPFDLGFGVDLHIDYSNDGNAVDPGHAIFAGPFGATGSSWNGSWFSHDSITGAGLTNLITDDNGDASLAEMAYGSGHVLFGGLTLPFFGEHPSWTAGTGELHRNILAYAAGQANAPIPEPATMTLIGLGLAGIALRNRKQRS